MDEELEHLKSYLKNHRVVTYALLLFVAFATVVIALNLQAIQNERAYITTSQAATQKLGNGCYEVILPDEAIQIGGGSGNPNCYRFAQIKCFNKSGFRCGKVTNGRINGCTVSAGEVKPGQSCVSPSAFETWAKDQCGCNELPTSTPTMTPFPTIDFGPTIKCLIPAGCKRPEKGACKPGTSTGCGNDGSICYNDPNDGTCYYCCGAPPPLP